MPDARDEAGRPRLDLPPMEEVEASLALHAPDREPIPGLYALNVEEVPLRRVIGLQAVVAFAVYHNLVVFGEPLWDRILVLALILEPYVAIQYVVLKKFFARLRRLHLGTVFLIADLPIFTAGVWATGGTESWIWPIYLIRVADQMWIGRRRAALMAGLGLLCYAGLLLLLAAGQGAAVPWSTELLKMAVLATLSAYLVSISGLPWNVQERTLEARNLILKLESQSIELDEARYRAEMASRSKSRFLARVSAEFRAPLNRIIGFASTMLADDRRPPQDLEYLTQVRSEAMHLLALVNDVIDIARLEAGGVDLDWQELDLEELIRDTVRQLEPRTQSDAVRVSVAFPRKLAPLRADEARLRQVLINLVTNALRHTRRGYVRVEVQAEPDGTPKMIRVLDTGEGIDPERLDAVFEAFGEDGRPRKEAGSTGLGLAISRSICRAMGFELAADSEPGKGSTFMIDLDPRPGRVLHPDGLPEPRGAAGSGDGAGAPRRTDANPAPPR